MKTGRKAGKDSEVLKSFIALLIGILFAVVIAETILQIVDFPARPVSGWLSCGSHNNGQCNSLGFRGREIAYSDDDFVVILLGDSEVYSMGSSFKQIPERRLEYYLQKYKKKVKVFTIADPGYGQDQQYLALKKYFEKYRADLVILMFTARNDVENNTYPTAGRNSTIKPTFWLKDNKLHGPTEGWLEPIGPALKLKLLWNIHFKKPYGELRNILWDEKILPRPDLSSGEYDVHNLQHQDNEKSERKDTENDTNEISRRGILFLNGERTKYGINLTRELFFKIKELVEANNGRFIILKEERPDETYDLNSKQIYSESDETYEKSIRQYQDNLKDLFEEFDHYRIPLNLRNYTRGPDNSHLNEQAIDQLYREVSLILNTKDYFK